MELRSVYVISELPPTARDLKAQLNQSGRFRVKENLGQADLIDFRDSGLIIFDCIRMTMQQLQFVTRLKQAVPKAKILVSAHQIPVLTYQALAKMSHVATLQKPAPSREVVAALAALDDMQWDPLKKGVAQFPRFHTNETINMMVMRSGLLIPSRMTNYSNGGAFLSYKGISLRVGETVQVGLTEEQSAKAAGGLQFTAKIAWLQNGSDLRDTDRGVGIQFISSL